MITDTLKIAIADHIAASLIVQSYHWNVEGQNFKQFHDIFGEIYSDYYTQIDTLAEYIRIISSGGDYVNVSLEVVMTNRTIKGSPIVGDKPIEMVKAVIELNSVLSDHYKTLFDEATKGDLQGLADYCASRLDVLTKNNWMLVSTTKTK